MNKFNLPRRNIQKERRQKRAERRKQRSAVKAPSAAEKSSTALSLNVSAGAHSGYLSGKNRAKLTKKWRRAQKEALQSGLVTMHDIEMMAVDGAEEGATTDEGVASVPKSKKKFSMKKRAKLRLRGAATAPQAGEPVSTPAAAGDDAMMQ